jgi:UDP-N-acetylmuramate--alanine ligase
VESDHQDFFPTYESILGAFVEYCLLLPPGGELIYCADDPGAGETARIIEKENRGVVLIPYGFTAPPPYQINAYRVENERALFSVAAFPGEFAIRVPGRHEALNVTAALALTSILMKKEFGGAGGAAADGWNEDRREGVRKALEEFRGSKRRSEIIGEAGGIIFMDDYGHHPTAIKTTLEGIKNFYPSRRLVVSFMSHTYSRTAALLDDFARSLSVADALFLHKIYASAREQYSGGVNGRTLYEKVKELQSAAEPLNSLKADNVYYVDEPLDAIEPIKKILKPGDLFITLGAGNNWPLGLELFNFYRNRSGGGER